MKLETKYEKWVVALSVVLLAMVCGTGIWVYNRLSTVADNIVQSRPQDTRLVMLKELNTQLITAENYVYAVAFQGNDTILKDFYELRTRTGMKMKSLSQLPSKDSLYKRNIDTLSRIVTQRFETMEELILVQNENRVNDAMDQVMSEVKSMTNRPSASIPVPAKQQEQEKERRRLFQRKKKQQETAQTQPVQASGVPTVNASAINRELTAIRKDVVGKEVQHNSLKLGLEQKNNRLLTRFTQLIQNMEGREKKGIMAEANEARLAADETNQVIALFCVVSVLLIGFVAFLIYTLIRKTRATNAQLVIAKERSDQLTASKSRFLANMSHEIRTPLNAIVGFSEQLSHAAMKEDDQRKMTIIRKSADHLTQITNDILDFSRINAGSIQLETIPVSIREEVAFLEESLGEIVLRNDNKLRIEVDEDVPEWVLGDALRMRQILLNLLSNAMKFTKNGTVKLSVKPSQQTATQLKLVFAVSDTGIGISPENIERIFDEFEQAETSTTRNYGGTGLGLSITRNLVQLMNGELHVKSEPDKGTTFTFTIPFMIAEAPEKEVAAEPVQDLSFLRGKRILIVDDELYNRKLLRNMLQAWDTVITESADGEEALQEVAANDYDLVLLDLRMPKMDGFQTRKAIQQLGEEKAGIPVIALTAALTHEERVSMLEDQWKGVLLKPLKVKDLAQCLQPLFDVGATTTKLNGVNGHKAEEKAAHAGDAVISLEPLREISGNDRKFYLDMLKTFLRTTRDGIQAINQTSKAQDWEGMAEAAHKIASPVRHVQANEVYEMLKQLEREGRANTIGSSVQEQIAKLNDSVEEILQLINSEIERVE